MVSKKDKSVQMIKRMKERWFYEAFGKMSEFHAEAFGMILKKVGKATILKEEEMVFEVSEEASLESLKA